MNPTRLFVGNLSYQTEEKDLQDHFSQAGVVLIGSGGIILADTAVQRIGIQQLINRNGFAGVNPGIRTDARQLVKNPPRSQIRPI